jgi:hypothetical protein
MASEAATGSVADDGIDEILEETETLMEDLDIDDVKEDDSAGMVFQGFSIDSDSEGGDDGNDNNNNGKVEIDDHPLSDHLLSAPTEPTPTAAGASGANDPTMQGTVANGGVKMDAFKQQTDALKQQASRFALNLGSMAQRAAREVAAATNTVPVTGGPVQGAPVVQPQGSPYRTGGMNQAPPGTPGIVNMPGNNSNFTAEQRDCLIKEHVGDLLTGEKVMMFLADLLHVGDSSGASYFSAKSPESSMWCCVLTYYRLILFSTSTAPEAQLHMASPAGWNPLCWPTSPSATKMLELPLGSMDRVDKTVYQAEGTSYMGLVITSKDCGRVIRFTTATYADTGKAFNSINAFAFPGRRQLGYIFAFESKRQEVMTSIKVDETTGQQHITNPPLPKRFDAMIEFPRLLSNTSITQSPWVMWGSLNSQYHLSPTYPSLLVGPATLDETKPESQHIIRQCAAFRSGKRLPGLTWCSAGGASIWRCSQPKVGLQGNRSPSDELFLRHIAESARGANAMAESQPIYPRSVIQQLTGDYSKDWVLEPGCGLKILDLRPRSAAIGNRTGGKSIVVSHTAANYSHILTPMNGVSN